MPLTGCCIYLGQLSPGGESIEYTHATENSGMVGMTLHRVIMLVDSVRKRDY